MNNICDQQIQDILQSNSSIKQSVFKAIQEYLEYQNRFLDKVGTVLDQCQRVLLNSLTLLLVKHA